MLISDLKSKEEIDKLAFEWQKLQSPLRPSLSERLLFELTVKSLANEQPGAEALIIGDSPELRDLVARYHLRPVVAANDLRRILAMRQLRQYQGGLPEKIILTDWQQLDSVKATFPLVLIDLSLNSLSDWDDYEVVLGNVYGLLTKGGRLAVRINIFNPARKRRAIGEIIDELRRYPKHVLSLLWEMALYSEISIYDPQNFRLNFGKFFRDEITKLYQQGLLSPAEWQKVYYPVTTSLMTFPLIDKWEEVLHILFKLEARRLADDYLLADSVPFYICRKR